MQRPVINEDIPASGPEKGTVCSIYDYASYRNNRNKRPNTPYTRRRETALALSLRRKPTGHHIPSSWSRQYSYYPDWGRVQSLLDGLVAKCKTDLYDEIGGISLGRDLAEATMATTRFFRKVPAAAKLLKRGRFKKAAKSLGFKGNTRAIPNTYLGYTYAVAPLVQDIAHLWDFLTNKDPVVFRIVRTKRAPRYFQVTTQNLQSYVTQPLTARIERNYLCSARIIREMTSECFQPLEGVTFNPIPAIWDALPYSFVVDWFLPVESCLQQLYQASIKFKDGCNCIRCECTTSVTFPKGRISVEKTTNPYPGYCDWKAGLSSASSFYFSRVVDLSTKWSTAEALGAVRHSTHVGTRRLLNAFALAWQALSH